MKCRSTWFREAWPRPTSFTYLIDPVLVALRHSDLFQHGWALVRLPVARDRFAPGRMMIVAKDCIALTNTDIHRAIGSEDLPEFTQSCIELSICCSWQYNSQSLCILTWKTCSYCRSSGCECRIWRPRTAPGCNSIARLSHSSRTAGRPSPATGLSPSAGPWHCRSDSGPPLGRTGTFASWTEVEYWKEGRNGLLSICTRWTGLIWN